MTIGKRSRHLYAWSMSKSKNVLSFPERPRVEEESGQVIICQVGSERFALHIQVEDLPPVRPAIPMKRKNK